MFEIIVMIILLIASIVFLGIAVESYNVGVYLTLAIVSLILSIVILVNGCINGFINYPKTEGTHMGEISAVDLEGVYFRRYEVYLKTSNYTTQTDETVYKLYENETELVEKLKGMIGKQVKITYGHDGGKIPYNSCGTYHIKNVELAE